MGWEIGQIQALFGSTRVARQRLYYRQPEQRLVAWLPRTDQPTTLASDPGPHAGASRRVLGAGRRDRHHLGIATKDQFGVGHLVADVNIGQESPVAVKEVRKAL
jgi:hypothetical protein